MEEIDFKGLTYPDQIRKRQESRERDPRETYIESERLRSLFKQLSECYKNASVNHLKECRPIAIQVLEHMRVEEEKRIRSYRV